MAEKKFEHGLLKAGFSGAVAIGWLIFIILFLAFDFGEFRPNEKIAIILLSIFIITVLLGGVWVYWTLQMMTKKEWKMFKIKGFRWRILVSIIYGLTLLIILILCFWYVWTDFTFWQYLAIILVLILLNGGIMGALWAPWGTKHKDEMDKYGKEFGKKFEEGFKDYCKKEDEK